MRHNGAEINNQYRQRYHLAASMTKSAIGRRRLAITVTERREIAPGGRARGGKYEVKSKHPKIFTLARQANAPKPLANRRRTSEMVRDSA